MRNALSAMGITSDLPELIGLAHRILVLDHGRVAGIVTPPEGNRPTEREILDLALGLQTQDVPTRYAIFWAAPAHCWRWCCCSWRAAC